jgi:hypothetical protein
VAARGGQVQKERGLKKGSFVGQSSDGSTLSFVESSNDGLITGNIVDPATE